MKRRQFVYLVGLATASGTLAVACDANSDPTATTTTPTTAITDLEQELVIYSGRNERLIGELIKEFESQTNARVQVRYGDTAELASAILEEGPNSPADVFFGQDGGALGALQRAGRTAEIPNSLLNQVDSAFRSPEGQWVGISGRVRTVDYNTNLVKAADLPSSIFGFTDPKWRGKIGWAPTNGSFQSFVTAMRVIEGDDRAKEWLQGIRANNPKDYPNNTSIVEALTRGEIGLGFVNHYYLERIKQENPNVPVEHHFTEDVGSLVNVAGAAILNTANHPNIAQRFVEFLLSADSQNYFANRTFEYPLVSGIPPQGNLKSLDTIGELNQKIDLSRLDDLENTLKMLQEVGII